MYNSKVQKMQVALAQNERKAGETQTIMRKARNLNKKPVKLIRTCNEKGQNPKHC